MNQNRKVQLMGITIGFILYCILSIWARGTTAIPARNAKYRHKSAPSNRLRVRSAVNNNELVPETKNSSMTEQSSRYGRFWSGISQASELFTHKENDKSSAGGCAEDTTEGSWCAETAEKLNFVPLKDSIDRFSQPIRQQWIQRNCDNLYKHQNICAQPVPVCRSGGDPNDPAAPLIAVLAATTTRRVVNPHVDKIALFTLLLPSLVRTLDCGFRYVYVMGYDVGDPFYDSTEGINEVKGWFRDQIETPMLRRGISISLEPVKVANHLKKPGPVFLAMARAAYGLGAEFFYRVNDDTEFRGHWPKLFVNALMRLSPPYGIVGPSSWGSADAILTHDFCHRTHMEVFDMNYYPPELTDWWMDNWISRVYGRKRTFISKKVAVVHHTYAHGQRYEVNRANQRLLEPAIKNGRSKIRSWMLKNNASTDELIEFDRDTYSRRFKMIDISNIVH